MQLGMAKTKATNPRHLFNETTKLSIAVRIAATANDDMKSVVIGLLLSKYNPIQMEGLRGVKGSRSKGNCQNGI